MCQIKLRTVMIFPQFGNIRRIDNLRKKYDPLVNKIRPHITVGKFNSVEEAKDAYEREKDFDETFSCLINKISVEIIGDNEESIIEISYPLG